MTELDALILHIVRDQGSSHGLGVGRELEERTGKMTGVGTLYKALHRLERDGFLSARWEDARDEVRSGPRRRYYEITGVGAKALVGYRRHHRRIGRALGLARMRAT